MAVKDQVLGRNGWMATFSGENDDDMLDYIVKQIRKVNRERGYRRPSVLSDWQTENFLKTALNLNRESETVNIAQVTRDGEIKCDINFDSSMIERS